ncbi:MAG: hypothetical protein ACXADH_09615 [Candidatus Kariarchaeaceae archaeon]
MKIGNNIIAKMSSAKIGFSNMEGAIINDNETFEVGRITDFTMNYEFQLTQFIVEGANQYIRDQLSISRPNYKFLVPINNIDLQKPVEKIEKEGKVIYLNCHFSELRALSELDPGYEIVFSTMKKMTVYASDGKNCGRPLDVIFHSDNYVSFILGGSSWRELTDKVGLTMDIHLILPHRYIDRIEVNDIHCNTQASNLGKMLDDEMIDSDYMQKLHFQKISSDRMKLYLFRDPYLFGTLSRIS